MPLSRFNRNYELIVQVTDTQSIVVKPPIRISFSADKSVTGGLNKLTVRIYNLNRSNRLALVKDPDGLDTRQRKVIPLSLAVGYQDTLHILFKGTVHRGQNFREGPDQVTELEGLDGGFDFLNSFTSRTVLSKKRAIDGILTDMPNTGRGKITEQQQLIRPKVLVGASVKLIDDLINEEETWYIDDEKLYIIKDDEVISSYIPVVDASTGLLNTPTRQDQKVTFDTLMNPALKIGGLCELISTTAPHLDGVYKIDSMSLSGDNYGSDWSMAITCFRATGYTAL